MDPSELQQLLEPFSFLVGRWAGPGRGVWDPEHPFHYLERLLLEPIPGRPLIRYSQVTTVADSGAPSHAEEGYLRVLPEAAAELVLATPSGYTEIHRGKVEGTTLRLKLVALGLTPTARPLGRTSRLLELEGSSLRHQLEIAVGEEALAPHVTSLLDRE